GVLIDDLALVDGIGAVIQGDDSNGFTDDPPAISIDTVDAHLQTTGDWKVNFHAHLSHKSPHPVSVHWTVKGNSGVALADGTATVAPGDAFAPVSLDVPGADP